MFQTQINKSWNNKIEIINTWNETRGGRIASISYNMLAQN
jgi:hypothetical protein